MEKIAAEPFTDCRSNAPICPRAHVACCEDPGNIRFKHQRIPFEIPSLRPTIAL